MHSNQVFSRIIYSILSQLYALEIYHFKQNQTNAKTFQTTSYTDIEKGD